MVKAGENLNILALEKKQMMIRCPKCNKLLLKIELRGYVKYEIKCPRCKYECVSELQASEYNNKSKKRVEDTYGRGSKRSHSRWY